MESLQEWGEEVEDGAVYSVTLQRVRAEPAANGGPCLLAAADVPCPFVQYRTCKLRRLRAGTLPQLVRGLVSASAEGDPGYVPSFLATYHAFTTPGQVLELLLPLGPDRAVLQVLELWLHEHPEDFRDPPQHPSLRRLHGYLSQAAPGSEGCVRAKGLLQSFQEKPGGEQVEPEGAVCPGAAVPLPGLCVVAAGPQGGRGGRPQRPRHRGPVQRRRRLRQRLCAGGRAAPCAAESPAAGEVGRHRPALFLSAELLLPASRALRPAVQPRAPAQEDLGRPQPLSQIFSDDKNHLSCREILLQADAAQGVPDRATSPRAPRKVTPKPTAPEKPVPPPPGTVPYLGTFLTDLVMLDTALPDLLEGGLINFDKRRKEAEILLRIQRLQASCGGYALRPNPPVLAAFQRQGRLSEEQSYRISRLIEPPADSCPSSPRVRRSLSKRFSSLLLGAEALPPRLPSPKSGISPSGIGSSCEADEGPSAPGLLELMGPLCKSLLELPLSACPPEEPPSPLARRPCSPLYNQQGADSCIVRVSLENAQGSLYKSILLTSQDKTAAVVLRALQKHSLEGTPPGDFQLLQLLGGGRELLIPDGANAFYAMNPAANFDFVLRRKGPQAPSSPRPPRLSPSHRAPPPLPQSPPAFPRPATSPLPSAPGPLLPSPAASPCTPELPLPQCSQSPAFPPS
ncbi:ral guanine nucleotide dissociation stimulator-like 3 isoform X3 [Pelodiscus sinensis]|uniref:ral guanine nucleotide dissociation stimulator-like 3 isoform X3 n=1 Tax=Pelodiscus sinensis TaxID=13735 RepID=UPI003F6D2FDB